MRHDEELAALREENARLRAELAATRDTPARIEARLAEVERRETPPPPFARPDTPAKGKGPRQRREARHNAGRRREEATRVVAHAVERRPDCGYLLRGGAWTGRGR